MKKNNNIKIGKKIIGDNKPLFIIADLGLTNGGDIKRTFKLIDIASKLKIDAVKFQLIGPDHILGDKKISHAFPTLKNGIIKQNMYEMFKELEFTEEEWFKISKYVKSKNLEFICTSHYIGAVEILEKCNINVHKICTWSTNHKRLIQKIGKTKKPLLIDTGVLDINKTDKIFNWHKNSGGKGFLVLHDFHTNKIEEMNFNSIPFIKKRYNCPVGFTPQGRGDKFDYLSIGLGANILEKRLTISRSIPKNGHWKSLEPKEFENWINNVRDCEKALGSYTVKPTKIDLKQSKTYFKSLYSKINIKKNQKIKENMLISMRPGNGISVEDIDKIVGLKARKNISEKVKIKMKDLK